MKNLAEFTERLRMQDLSIETRQTGADMGLSGEMDRQKIFRRIPSGNLLPHPHRIARHREPIIFISTSSIIHNHFTLLHLSQHRLSILRKNLANRIIMVTRAIKTVGISSLALLGAVLVSQPSLIMYRICCRRPNP